MDAKRESLGKKKKSWSRATFTGGGRDKCNLRGGKKVGRSFAPKSWNGTMDKRDEQVPHRSGHPKNTENPFSSRERPEIAVSKEHRPVLANMTTKNTIEKKPKKGRGVKK